MVEPPLISYLLSPFKVFSIRSRKEEPVGCRLLQGCRSNYGAHHGEGPEGPAEIIVLTNRMIGDAGSGSQSAAKQGTLAALAELRSVPLTPAEKDVLDGFETFRQEHPLRFTSLKEEG